MCRKMVLIMVMLSLLVTSTIAQEIEAEYGPWQLPEKIETGTLAVSDIHTLHYMTGGNPDGIPIFMLHGGPGAASGKGYFTFADPERFFIVVYDQRGCGLSTPFAELAENTTWDLVEDINRLKAHLKIENPAVLWGVSWGATLALAYAEKYPEQTAGMVLVSTFTGLRWEIDHIYHGGAGINWPENYAWLTELVEDKEGDLPGQYHAMVTGEDEDLAAEAAMRITAYELKMVMSQITAEQAINMGKSKLGKSFAKISTYYMMNQCFFEEGQLLDNADRIRNIPTYIVSGRADPVTPPKASYDLSLLLDNAVFEAAPGALHNDPPVFSLARKGVRWVADQLDKN